MTKQDLQGVLNELNWSQAELSRRVGVVQNTVSRWKQVPKPVEAYINLAVEIHRLWHK